MSTHSKRERMKVFLERLNEAEPAGSRDEALDLMKRLMKEVEDEHNMPPQNFAIRMHVWGWKYDWKNLEGDPCYWIDSWSATHKTEIYRDGRIVISRVKEPTQIVLDKPGK